jgi:hypothetical protein
MPWWLTVAIIWRWVSLLHRRLWYWAYLELCMKMAQTYSTRF